MKYLLPPAIGFFTGYYIYFHTSAPGTGQPNKAEVWLQKKKWVSENFHFSMRVCVLEPFRNRYMLHVHFHHWLYCLVMIIGVAGFELSTESGRNLSLKLGDFTMGWLYGMGAGEF